MSGSTYICIKQFNARLGDELSLKVGDKIEVLADDSEYNDGWYMGKNLLTNDVGLYPKSFTQVLKLDSPPLLRSRSRRIKNNDKSGTASADTSADASADVSLDAEATKGSLDVLKENPVDINNVNPNDINATDVTSKALPVQDSKPTNLASLQDTLKDRTDKSDANLVQNKMSAPQDVKIDKVTDGMNGLALEERDTISDINNAILELNGDQHGVQHGDRDSDRNVRDGNDRDSDRNGYKYGNLNNRDIPSKESPLNINKPKVLAPAPLDPTKAGSWSPEQVAAYFQSINFESSIANKFLEHQITGDILFELDLTHLKELDIDKFGTRFQIYKEIENLRNLQVAESSTNTSNAIQNKEIENLRMQSERESISTTSSNTNANSSVNNNLQDEFVNVPTQDPSPGKPKQAGLMPSAAIYQKGHERKRSKSIDGLDTSLDRHYQFGDKSIGSTELYRTKTETSRPSSSVYEASMYSHNRQQSGSKTPTQPTHHGRQASSNSHRRHSSIFSFFSNNDDSNKNKNDTTPKLSSPGNDVLSPTKIRRQSGFFSPQKQRKSSQLESPLVTNIDNSEHDVYSPKKSKSVSYKSEPKDFEERKDSLVDEKRSTSDSTTAISRLKTLRTTSTQNFKSLTTSKKSKTSAFQEGIQEVSPDEAIKSANYSGWMSKRSGNFSWRSRYFTLHGTRLSYFTSLKDRKEKGLIDITAHKVIPVHTEQEAAGNNDKYVALYASSTGFGRYCFKLVPPAPGFKKGLTFTQPKIHYFAVETQEEMKGWMKALMTATIDIDDSVPVVSSCSTPTVTLAKAQELLAKAREETRLKDEELRSKGYVRDGFEANSTFGAQPGEYGHFMNENDIQNSFGSNSSPVMDSHDDTTVSSHTVNGSKPKLTIDSNVHIINAYGQSPSTPSLGTNSQGGFASPYLLASGLMSPKSGGVSSPAETPTNARDYFTDHNMSSTSTSNTSGNSPIFSNHVGRVMSGRKSSKSDKMLSYTSDSSGNLTFQIKKK